MNENCFFHELASPSASEIAELPRYPPKSPISRHNVVKSAGSTDVCGNKNSILWFVRSFVRSFSAFQYSDAADDENGGFAYGDRQSAAAAVCSSATAHEILHVCIEGGLQ